MGISRKSGLPVGTIVPRGHVETSGGYLPCDGAPRLIASYPRLAAKWGTTYGGDGVTTFGVIDMRGESFRGLDQGRGVDVGRVLGVWQDGQMPSHSHGPGGQSTLGGVINGEGIPGSVAVSVRDIVPVVAAGGTTNASENRTRNMAVPFYVKT